MWEVQAWDAKKVRSKPEFVRRMENRSRREFDGPLSLEERRTCITPPEITWGELCWRQRQGRRRIQSMFAEQGTSRYGWRNKWRNFSLHSSQNDWSAQVITIAARIFSLELDYDFSTTKTKQLEAFSVKEKIERKFFVGRDHILELWQGKSCWKIALRCVHRSLNTRWRSVWKWNKACDPRLLILLNSINQIKNYRQFCHLEKWNWRLQTCFSTMLHLQEACGIQHQRQGGLLRIWITHVCFHFVDLWEAGVVFHSRTESERISFEAGLRTDGSSVWGVCVVGYTVSQINQWKLWACWTRGSHSDSFVFWHLCIWVHRPLSAQHFRQHPHNLTLHFRRHCGSVQMINEGRSQNLRHVTRMHRVDMDYLFERVN